MSGWGEKAKKTATENGKELKENGVALTVKSCIAMHIAHIAFARFVAFALDAM